MQYKYLLPKLETRPIICFGGSALITTLSSVSLDVLLKYLEGLS